MESEKVVIQSPTSFVGSSRRIWKLTDMGPAWTKVSTVPIAVLLIAAAWVLVAIWTLIFGLLLVPWRLLRRGARKRKQEQMRHRELLNNQA